MGQYIEEGNNIEKNQEVDIKEIIERLKEQVKDDLKVIFFSSNSDNNNHYVSYRFPIEMYNENIYKAIVGYAKQDMLIRKQMGEIVNDSTKLLFCDRNEMYLGEAYNYKHDQEFLDSLNEENAKTL